MRRVQEKSIILGIGIGIVITSIIGLIYFGASQNEINSKQLSKEEIIRLAKGYGMVEQVQFIGGDDSVETTQSTAPSASTNTASASTIAREKANTPQETVTIEVKSGYDSEMVANLLLETGVITDKSRFIAEISQKGYADKLRVGTYKFNKNEEIDLIIQTICSIK